MVMQRIDCPGPASTKPKSWSRSASAARAHLYTRDDKDRDKSLTRPEDPDIKVASRGHSQRSTPASSSRTSLMNESEGDFESLGEGNADDLPTKRGRGRLPTTGEHVGLREKKEKEAALRKEQRTKRALSENAPPPPFSKDLRTYEAQCADVMGLTPTPDIAARSLEQAATIDRIATCSGNLKGSFQKRLRKAAALVRVASRTLAERAQQTEGEGELAALRRDLKFLGERNEYLQKEIQELRGKLGAVRRAKPSLYLSLPDSPGRSLRKKRGVPGEVGGGNRRSR